MLAKVSRFLDGGLVNNQMRNVNVVDNKGSSGNSSSGKEEFCSAGDSRGIVKAEISLQDIVRIGNLDPTYAVDCVKD